MERTLLGSTLYGRLSLGRCERSPGMWDLVWQGRDPQHAICEDMTALMSMCWSLMSLRTGGKPPRRPRPLPLGDGMSWWLARLAAGDYRIERGNNGGELLFEYHPEPAPRKRTTRLSR